MQSVLRYFRGGCVGADVRVYLTGVEDVIVFANICMIPSLQEGSKLPKPKVIFISVFLSNKTDNNVRRLEY